MKLKNFTQGVKPHINFWFFVLFLGFILWLFVLYWVRHHEPAVNAVVGTKSGNFISPSCDHRMVAQLSNALPYRCINTVQPYIHSQQPARRTCFATQPAFTLLRDTVSGPDAVIYAHSAMPSAMPVLPPGGTNLAGVRAVLPLVQPSALQGSPFSSRVQTPFARPSSSGRPILSIAEPTPSGARLKTIVNR